MSLQSPDSKMSKSDPNKNGTLYITDEPDVLRKKIMSAVTDSGGEVRYDETSKKGISNLMNIMSALSGKPLQAIEDEFAGKGYGDFKRAVADTAVEALAPVREKYIEISSDKRLLEEALKRGGQAAQKRAFKTMSKVRRKVGFMDFD